MNEIIKQAPEGVELKIMKEIFEKNNEDITLTLMELWNIKETKEKKRTKWDDIRETCDAFDTEMNKMFKKNAIRL